jgi:hypothetical protein
MINQLTQNLQRIGLICTSLVLTPAFAEISSDSSQTSFSQITPPAGFAAAQGIGFSIYADFIYWQTHVANLDFAESNVSDSGGVISRGSVYYPGFKYQPGFKVGLAIDVGHDNWDLTAEYVRLNGSGSKNFVTKAEGPSQIAATRPVVVGDPMSISDLIIAGADGNFGYLYNLVNLDLGRNYFISGNLTLRPFFGLSGAWDKTSSLVHYTDIDDSDDLSLHYVQHYYGVGYRTGLNTAWCFNENFSIYGDLTLMNLWSRYQANAKETSIFPPAAPTVTYNTQGTQYGLQYVVDIQMGIRWAMRFNDDTMGFGLQAGWDQQVWINHVQSPVSTSASNLSIQGLDIRARFDF